MQEHVSKPLVSIIIAVYNGADTLHTCLNSMIEQTYPHKEIIIIDGGSVDGTIDIIKSNERHVQDWVSESDDGIYHAWNKALTRANGEWICFLGCDDAFAHSDALTNMMAVAVTDKNIEFLSGKANILDRKGEIKRVKGNPWQWSKFKRAMGTIVHPGALHHRKLFERLGKFDQNYRIAGDYEFLLRAGSNLCTAFIPEIVVNMGGAGVSSALAMIAYREACRAQSHAPDIGKTEAKIYLLVGIAKYCVGLVRHHVHGLVRKKFGNRRGKNIRA